MDREFLDLYNRELELLYEHAAEFAEEYPGIAERLGGIVRGQRPTRWSAGLLEGSAFLAARVQLKLKHEFPGVHQQPSRAAGAAFSGARRPPRCWPRSRRPSATRRCARGARSRGGPRSTRPIVELERRVACRFRLTAPVTLWPFELTGAEYLSSPSAVQALAFRAGEARSRGCGCRSRSAPRRGVEDEPSDAEAATRPDHWFAGCRRARVADPPPRQPSPTATPSTSRSSRTAAASGSAIATRSAIRSSRLRRRAPCDSVGFDEEDALLPNDNRVFRGFDLLQRVSSSFPASSSASPSASSTRSCRGCRRSRSTSSSPSTRSHARLLGGRAARHVRALRRAGGQPVRDDDRPRSRSSRTSTNSRSCPTAAVPRFRAAPDPGRLRPLCGRLARKRRCSRSTRAPATAASAGELCYTVRRLPRRRTAEERKYGSTSDYTGTGHVHLARRAGLHATTAPPSPSSACGRCAPTGISTEHLPVGEGGADFRLARRHRRSTSSASPGRRRRASRWRRICAAGPRPRTPAWSPGA